MDSLGVYPNLWIRPRESLLGYPARDPPSTRTFSYKALLAVLTMLEISGTFLTFRAPT